MAAHYGTLVRTGLATLHCNRPPAGEWFDLTPEVDGGGGYLFVYYSDDLSSIPVRFITKPGDNKSDPNLETGSFGLFSTCGRSMRSGIVKRRSPHVFFLTKNRSGRVLAGYYHMRWYGAGAFGGAADYRLAADEVRFLDPPIPVSKLRNVGGIDLSSRFRGTRLVTPRQCQELLRIVRSRPDRTDRLLDEIDRLERFNLRHGGFRYIAWKQTEKFSWDLARTKYLRESDRSARTSGKRNSSASGRWRCGACKAHVLNTSLLKRCPECGAIGSLTPAS